MQEGRGASVKEQPTQDRDGGSVRSCWGFRSWARGPHLEQGGVAFLGPLLVLVLLAAASVATTLLVVAAPALLVVAALLVAPAMLLLTTFPPGLSPYDAMKRGTRGAGHGQAQMHMHCQPDRRVGTVALQWGTCPTSGVGQ